MMMYELNEIYVDAGCFVIGDRDFFISHGADPALMKNKDHMFAIQCKPGKHRVTYEMDTSWNTPYHEDDEEYDPETETHMLNIPSGELWITDACYVIRDDAWQKFIDDDYLDNDDEFHFTVDTGGDGEFDIRLWIM